MPTPKKKPAVKKAVAATKKTVAKKAVAATKKPVAKKTVVKKPAAKKTVVVKKKVVAKAKAVPFIPKGYTCITPYLIVNGGVKALAFYKKVFGAKEVMRMDKPGGKIGHAEMLIGDAKFMLADMCPEMGARSPKEMGGSPVGIHVYIKDVDTVVKRAVAAGAKLTRPVETMFYGDRCGSVVDPFGHNWYVATHVEHVTPLQMKKRMAEMSGKK